MTKKKTATIVLFAIASSGCFTTGAESPASPEGSAPAVDATVPSDASDAAVGPTPASPAEKAACVANPASCLMGTAAATRFSVPPAQMKAKLYRVFPVGKEQPIETQLVDDAGAWTFGGSPDAGLAAWAHYYVQMEADFNVKVDGGTTSAIAALAGPLGVPSTGAPVGVDVPPVQLNVLESRAPGGNMQLQWVLAHVFDPATGDEIVRSATVSIAAGGSPQTIPWSAADAGGVNGYFRQFAPPLPAQASYTVSVSAPQFGQAAATFQLVADVPAFDGAIVAPDGGAPVDAGQPLSVTWAAEPQADYEVVQIFTSGGLASVYVSPQPDPPDQTQETIVPGLDAGSYLLNISYSKTNCPATAAGCVQANTVSAGAFTAQ